MREENHEFEFQMTNSKLQINSKLRELNNSNLQLSSRAPTLWGRGRRISELVSDILAFARDSSTVLGMTR